MKCHWITSNAEKSITYHIEINEKRKRIVGWETTGHWKSEVGGYVSFDNFLNGDWDAWIAKRFGEDVLSELKTNTQILNTKD